jgi:cholesterol transport system auxiliary component
MFRKILQKLLIIATLALLIQGCFSPVSLPEIHKYQLTINSSTCSSIPKTARTLFISLPHASAPYNTTQMVYSQTPNEICSFAENRWVTPLSQMTLPLMIQSIRNTHHFKAVAGFPTVVNTDYRLETFKQEFCGQKSRVHITLDAALILAKTQQIIATRRIEVIVPASCKTPQAGVRAYQRAFNKVLRQLNWFTIRNT